MKNNNDNKWLENEEAILPEVESDNGIDVGPDVSGSVDKLCNCTGGKSCKSCKGGSRKNW